MQDHAHEPDAERRIILLGSTGSIGVQTLGALEHLERLRAGGVGPSFRVVGLAAGRRSATLFEQAARLGVRDVAIADAEHEGAPRGLIVRRGADAAERLVREVDADIVLGAMVGAAGLPATLAALGLGRDVALANKETLVAAGELVVGAARAGGARILPVDSEHSAIWQCLPAGAGSCPPCVLGAGVARVVLTASGGPFRTWPLERMQAAGPDEALAHPTWDMGAKVTVDCASMTNKALEVIEAHWLFGLENERIGVIVHPQSIVHSFVEFADGSVVAQLGAPDMRTPIQWALTWPERLPGCSTKLDWASLKGLDFEPADAERFPALGLARRVIEAGGVAGAVFNAANERAVGAFLDRRIPFGRITSLTAAAVDSLVGGARGGRLSDLSEVMAADRAAREHVERALGG